MAVALTVRLLGPVGLIPGLCLHVVVHLRGFIHRLDEVQEQGLGDVIDIE